jgi:predicted DNA-binding transcriptional regulator YafY
MSKLGYFSRYSLIIKKLQQKPFCSYEELKSHLEFQLQFMDEDLQMGYSKRTLQRDFKEIYNLYGFQIEYSKKEKGYYISEGVNDNASAQKMMEAFDVFNALGLAQDMSPFVQTQKLPAPGTENLYGLLHAIRNRLIVRFTYEKFEEDIITERSAKPYFLKEFRNRWYLIAEDEKDNVVKSFALDRLSALDITNQKYKAVDTTLLEQRYRFCFGIVGPNDKEPKRIVLSFDPLQGKYIKSLPLHDTQQILVDSDDELRISLHIFITYDFIMELLSFGQNLRVLQPKSLANRLKKEHQKAAEVYEKIKMV